MNRRSLIFGSACVVATGQLTSSRRSNAQGSEARDGNWWRAFPKEERPVYLVGFFDGMELGNRFSYWQMDKAVSCSGAAILSYSQMMNQYLSNITNGQLADGLDDFYNDYRNRSILVHNAVWLVVQGIAGTPKDELEKHIETWRKNANQSR